MNILLLGSGGRESALAWKLRQSPLCSRLYIAPGNAGTAQYGTNIALQLSDLNSIKTLCLEKDIHLVLPGSEDTLVAGIWDVFRNDDDVKHIIVAGPSQQGAMLEGSKAFAKEFMQRHGIPTATYRRFDSNSFDDGINYLKSHAMPVVLKADGLAAGKGVVIAQNEAEAVAAFTAMIKDSRFGDAGKTVVVEEFLSGIELSVFVLTDGNSYVLLPEAKDYKRLGEGDTGPNTGGMGAVSPVPFADSEFMNKVTDRIIKPTISGLRGEGIIYMGFIFFGLIRVGDEPYVIEYNCRLGDPETEVIIPRLKTDLLKLLLDMANGKVGEAAVVFDKRAACTVMLVADGYPDQYAKGMRVTTGDESPPRALLFHAGARHDGQDVVTNGGRVMAITSYGQTIADALAQCYSAAAGVHFEGKTFRKDIGYEFL